MVLETLRLSTTVWASHFHTKAITHQICIAHLLRDLNYLDQLYNHKWSKAVKILFQIALVLKKQMDIPNYYAHNHRRAQLERRLDFLIAYRFPDEKNELTTFQNRLKKYRNYVFTFLYRQEVPPDNNASGRAIGPALVGKLFTELFNHIGQLKVRAAHCLTPYKEYRGLCALIRGH